jgi:16S rRNA processing protein RimM
VIAKQYLEIAKITSPHGLKGEVKIYLYGLAENFKNYKNLYLGEEKLKLNFSIKRIASDRQLIISLENSDSRESAEDLRDELIYVEKSQLEKLKKGQFYNFELIGLELLNHEGKQIGEVLDMVNHGGGDNLLLKFNNGKEEEYPFTKEIFTKVSLKKGNLVFNPPEMV